MTQKIVILNAGGQYSHLIARKIRELGVYAEIDDFETDAAELTHARGIIISGGPDSVYDSNAPKISMGLFKMGIPILGICYGHQLMAHMLGGEVKEGKVKEYGTAEINIMNNDSIFNGLPDKQTVWMSHGDLIEKLPEGFENLSASDNCNVAAMANLEKRLYGLQFHPEVAHSTYGKDILKNFLFNICKIKEEEKNWNPKSRKNTLLCEIKEKSQGRKVVFFVSGGIDSTVAFCLCVEALGKENVKGIYIDTGLMRKNETETIINNFEKIKVDNIEKLDNIEILDKSNEFISSLRNVYDPEEKRQIIGKMFVGVEKNIFDKINSSNNRWILGQGTIYPDTIESGCSKKSKKIKTHHNRVDEILKLIKENKVIEPISEFYKDEVRKLAKEELNLPENIVKKEPFPGPGLAVRCICNPEEKIVEHDEELTSILSKHGLKGFIAPVKTVGVQGDFRSYKEIAIIYGNISMSGLGRLSSEIVNTINRINRVAYIVNTTKEDIGKIRIHKAYIDRTRLSILKEADYIVRKFVENNRERLPDIWQFPVVLFPLGYDRDETIVLRPILSTDGMTAEFAKIDKNLIERVSQEILKINGISTVLYDVTNKPPATIEWE